MGRFKGQTIKISIVNLMKCDSLYNYGMKICTFSMKGFELKKQGWHRGGFDFSYRKNETPSTYVPEKEVNILT
jgi:hypothetical protein